MFVNSLKRGQNTTLFSSGSFIRKARKDLVIIAAIRWEVYVLDMLDGWELSYWPELQRFVQKIFGFLGESEGFGHRVFHL